MFDGKAEVQHQNTAGKPNLFRAELGRKLHNQLLLWPVYGRIDAIHQRFYTVLQFFVLLILWDSWCHPTTPE